MKVLSVRQPWAGAILTLGKDVENRSWVTNYRGPVLIHASSKLHSGKALVKVDRLSAGTEWAVRAIIGAVELIDVVKGHPSPWAEAGQWHWVFDNPVVLKAPVPMPGKMGLFELPEILRSTVATVLG